MAQNAESDKNLLMLAGPVGASQQVRSPSNLKTAITRTKDELAQLQNDVTQLRTQQHLFRPTSGESPIMQG